MFVLADDVVLFNGFREWVSDRMRLLELRSLPVDLVNLAVVRVWGMPIEELGSSGSNSSGGRATAPGSSTSRGARSNQHSIFRRVDGGSGPGAATVEVEQEYRLEPGRAGLFDVGDIHAIDHPAGARFLRVTGCDLDRVPRLKFDVGAGTASVIEDASAGSA